MMLPALMVFLLVVGVIVGAFGAWVAVTTGISRRRLDQRLRDVGGAVVEPGDPTVVKQHVEGALPAVERLIARTPAGMWLTRLIERAGAKTTPSAVILSSLFAALALVVVVRLVVRVPFVGPAALLIGLAMPSLWLMRQATVRLRRFEEQFPDALDLLSRAIRAGHAFQTALGMGAEELPAPVGVEFKKVFDQQNFGLPLRDALNELAERIPTLDVRFFVTAIAIQRESGGNLAEILDNLAHVVRERFKIFRQVRTHTAHGRFTGFVLLALPAALAIALSFINPGHMEQLFTEPMGRMMIGGAIVMQTVGFVWIRKVIKIEV
jgi:tight adherence protein B